MAEPWRLNSPFSRVKAIRGVERQDGLADPQTPVTVGGEFDQFYPKDGSAWTTNSVLGRNADDLKDTLPGRFSGHMRLIVQDHLSRGLTIPYSYSFAKTHGIFTASNGDLYVIEITSGGIRAWQMETATPGDASKLLDTLSYVPRRSPDPADASVINVTVVGIGAVYGYAALFSECGWAFSDDGHQAANVVFEDRTDAPANPGPTYSYARLYTITITEADNKPFSASLSLDEEDWAWGDRVSHLKYPDYANETLFSFDWYKGVTGGPTSGDRDVPLHCWYEADTLQVVRWHASTGTSSSLSAAQPWSLPPSNTINPDPIDFSKWGTGTQVTGISAEFSSPLLGQYAGSTESGTVKQWVVELTREYVAESDSSPNHFWRDVKRIAIRTEIGASKSDKVSQDNVVIPLNEREGIYHYRKLTTSTTTTQRSHDQRVGYYDTYGGLVSKGQSGSGIGITPGSLSRGNPHNNASPCGGQNLNFNMARSFATGSTCSPFGVLPGTKEIYNMAWGGQSANEKDPPKNYIHQAGDCNTYGDSPTDAASKWVALQTHQPNPKLDSIWLSNTTPCGMKQYSFNWSWDGGGPSTETNKIYEISGIYVNPIDNVYWGPNGTNYGSINESTDTETIKAIINGETITLPTDTNIDAAYSRYIDDPVLEWQVVLAAVDMSANEGTIYVQKPIPDFGSLADQLTQTTVGGYPVDEISSVLPSWVGNP